MKTPKLLISLLLVPAAALLVISLACGHKGHVSFTAHEVHINNCTATPKKTDVYEGDTIRWIVDPPDTKTYTITFSFRKPVPSKSFPTTSSPQTVSPDLLCSVLRGSLCNYDYTMTPITTPASPVCNDPGVHVTPN
jgi:hypothetical protein